MEKRSVISKVGESNKSAIIIKGNPALIKGNKAAENFYHALASFLKQLRFQVEFDDGEPYTTPKEADLWIGHSRGSDRLRFAPQGTIVIGIGVPKSIEGDTFPIVNHPKDKMVKRKFYKGKVVEGRESDTLNDANHYLLTDDMKLAIIKIIERK